MFSQLDSPIFKARVIISLCGALFFGCMGMYELIRGGSGVLQLNQFVSNSIAVQSTVSEGIKETSYRYVIRFEYVASGSTFSKSEEVTQEFFNRRVNGPLIVRYDRNQPSTAYVDLGRLYGLARDRLLFGGGATIFCVGMFSFWYWMYFGRNRQSNV